MGAMRVLQELSDTALQERERQQHLQQALEAYLELSPSCGLN